MKKILFTFVSLFLVQIKAETCWLGIDKVDPRNPLPVVFKNTTNKEKFETVSAHECFVKALEKAKKSIGEDSYEVVRPATPPERAQLGITEIRRQGRVVVSWEYNDGYINDSDGTVSKYSKDCIEKNDDDHDDSFTGTVFRYEKNCIDKF